MNYIDLLGLSEVNSCVFSGLILTTTPIRCDIPLSGENTYVSELIGLRAELVASQGS